MVFSQSVARAGAGRQRGYPRIFFERLVQANHPVGNAVDLFARSIRLIRLRIEQQGHDIARRGTL